MIKTEDYGEKRFLKIKINYLADGALEPRGGGGRPPLGGGFLPAELPLGGALN